MIGSGSFIPGFEDQIIGHKAGEEFDIEVTFPKDYGEKSLADAKARFEIKLHRVLEVTPPKLDDELAKKTKMFKTLDELRADIRKNLIVSKEEAAMEDFKNRLVEALAKQTKVAIPNVLRDDQIRGLEQEFRQNLMYRGTTLEKFLENADKTYETWRKEELEPAAETRVKAGLALAEIAKELEIKITDTEVEDQLDQLKTQYAKNDDAIKQLNDPRTVNDIRSNLITQKAIDWLVEFNS
jgi:trigger factor